jgi:hypothetical protein
LVDVSIPAFALEDEDGDITVIVNDQWIWLLVQCISKKNYHFTLLELVQAIIHKFLVEAAISKLFF